MENNKSFAVKKSGHIYWLDGIKGIACILIFVHHFVLTFFPSAYTGEQKTTHLSGFDTLLAQSPLNVFLTGNFLVCVFCCISGLVLSYSIFNADNRNEKLSKTLFKRYPRLMLPLFVVTVIIFFMMKFNLFSNIAASKITLSKWLGSYYSKQFSWPDIFYTSFISVWFKFDHTFCTAFWMLSYIFYGSILSLSLSVISWNSNKKVLLCYVPAAAICIIENSLFLSFVFGTLIAFIMKNFKIKKNIFVGAVLVLLGLFFGGYPTGMRPTNFYAYFDLLPKYISAYAIYHILGAALFIFGVYMLKPLQKFLSVRIFQKLGKISYAVYLIHIPVLFSFSTTVFMSIYKSTGRYCRSVLITFLLSLILIIFLSTVFNKVIESNCTKVINFAVNFIYGKSKKKGSALTANCSNDSFAENHMAVQQIGALQEDTKNQ